MLIRSISFAKRAAALVMRPSMALVATPCIRITAVSVFTIVMPIGDAQVGAVALPSQSSAIVTTRIFFQPFSDNAGNLAVGYRIARAQRGYCWTSSAASPRANAYRCFLGHFISDPCFSTPQGADLGWVACPTENPFGRRLIRINLTRPLPAASDYSRGAAAPFAVRLALGRTCFASTGANGIVAGRAAVYYCAGGAVLGAKIYQTGRRWSAWYKPSRSRGRWRRVAVRLAAF